ncbi:hypothetical protein B0H19DRAFT_1258435 [Mycena capillaripes]|nr:hypothetical protein B0H19DRAFT_1258435 [Mycena capillaripes]
MNDEPQFEPEFAPESIFDDHERVPERHSLGLLRLSAFFSHSKNLIVSGWNFTNINPGIPPDFRVVSLGNLDLRHEIRLEPGSAVLRRQGPVPTRQMYSARIHGSSSIMTAAVYQRSNADEQWRSIADIRIFCNSTVQSARGVYMPLFSTTVGVPLLAWALFVIFLLNPFEIAFLTDSLESGKFQRKVLNSGEWLDSESVFLQQISVKYHRNHSVNSANVKDEYLRSMYNPIFASLDITPNLEDCVLVEESRSWLRFLGPINNLPPGYLFLCPFAESQTAIAELCGIFECAAFWSFDPWGAEPLSAPETTAHGFPDIELRVEVWGRSSDSSVYAGIRQFDEAKGVDLFSQEVAIELGYALFHVSSELDVLFAHDDYYSVSDGMSGGEYFSESGLEPYELSTSVANNRPRSGTSAKADVDDVSESEDILITRNVNQFHENIVQKQLLALLLMRFQRRMLSNLPAFTVWT